MAASEDMSFHSLPKENGYIAKWVETQGAANIALKTRASSCFATFRNRTFSKNIFKAF